MRRRRRAFNAEGCRRDCAKLIGPRPLRFLAQDSFPQPESGKHPCHPATARQYRLDDAFDLRANARAAAALWIDNQQVLRQGLRRDPTSGEIYLAHQQRATGAINLLTNPGTPAADIVGADAVTLNGGSGDMSAGVFAAKWVNRFQRD